MFKLIFDNKAFPIPICYDTFFLELLVKNSWGMVLILQAFENRHRKYIVSWFELGVGEALTDVPPKYQYNLQAIGKHLTIYLVECSILQTFCSVRLTLETRLEMEFLLTLISILLSFCNLQWLCWNQQFLIFDRARLLLSLTVEMVDIHALEIEGHRSTEIDVEKIPPLMEVKLHVLEWNFWL